jgi:hypothetical protein
MQILFPFLQKSPTDEAEYVTKICQELGQTFRIAADNQHAAAQKNLERNLHKQYQPDFEPGDWLLLWERSAAETRFQTDVRRLDTSAEGKLPEKFQNKWTGPYKMLAWEGPLKCVIMKDGKEAAYNVNRLTKQYPWDDGNLDTSESLTKKHRPNEERLTKEQQRMIAIDDIIVFPKAVKPPDDLAPFGVGRVTEIAANGDIKFRWLGNKLYEPNKKFEPGWWDPKDNKIYYGRRIGKHPELTNETTETPMSVERIIVFGKDVLDATSKIAKKAREDISVHITDYIAWNGRQYRE